MSSALYAMRLMWHGNGRGEWGCSGIHVDVCERPPVLVTIGVV